MTNILATLTSYKAKKAELKKAEKELDSIKAEILSYMEEKGVRELDCKSIKAVLTECQKTGFDKKTFETENPDLAGKYDYITVYDRFDVK